LFRSAGSEAGAGGGEVFAELQRMVDAIKAAAKASQARKCQHIIKARSVHDRTPGISSNTRHSRCTESCNAASLGCHDVT
jgi:hypothetical protein